MGEPFVRWPPPYPVVLGLLRTVTGVDLLEIARVLNALLLGISIFIAGILIQRSVQDRSLALALSIAGTLANWQLETGDWKPVTGCSTLAPPRLPTTMPPMQTRLTHSRWILLSGFFATLFLIGWVWWPLVQEYIDTINPLRPWFGQVDWLLIGLFATMTFLIMARADIRADGGLIVVGLVGGLAIESWGTQTGLWSYYTFERPPLWILPAWPIATLSIDRLTRALRTWTPEGHRRRYAFLKGLSMGVFLVLMFAFVRPTLDQPATIAALALSAALIVAPSDPREYVLTFAAGAGLGYFLELWGTTRGCWNYYTLETPPLFAVLAHGMAAVAFVRGLEVLHRMRAIGSRLALTRRRVAESSGEW